jgi:hypothetical protein
MLNGVVLFVVDGGNRTADDSRQRPNNQARARRLDDFLGDRPQLVDLQHPRDLTDEALDPSEVAASASATV